MKIEKIIVKNFRLLKDFSMDLEDSLSLVIGKNNVGKTSLLLILDQFLGSKGEYKRSFRFNDLNLDAQEQLKEFMNNALVDEDAYSSQSISISLRLIISYTDKDVLANISPLLMDLDIENHYLALGFDHYLSYEGYKELHQKCATQKAKHDAKYAEADEKPVFDVIGFLEENAFGYFQLLRKTIKIDKDGNLNETDYIDIKSIPNFKIENVILFQSIGARRSVDNADVDKTLSSKTSELYKAIEENEEQLEAKESFLEQLKETDIKLSSIYANIFADIINKIRLFGGISKDDTIIKVISSLQHRELLKGNTTVKYEHDSKDLPESFNGLGYMNLISIIFDIELMRKKFAKMKEQNGLADINLLFIEEPEAHTHPQMQYIFIKNIKELLNEGVKDEFGNARPLQYIVTTHSSHLVADSNYDDIKYIHRLIGKNEVKAKSLRDLSKQYENNDHLRFLKQYITINRSEMFFADKAILIEGDTERILLPAIIKKTDATVVPAKSELPLLSQNVSIIEVGAHAEIFVKLLNFLELSKVLVLTDFDCCSPDGYHEKQKYEHGKNMITSNTALKYFYGNDVKSDDLSAKMVADKLFIWDETRNKMLVDEHGNYMVCYQTAENGYQPRSFEDDFIALNKQFILEKDFSERAIAQNYKEGFHVPADAYEVSDKVKSKAMFAFEILLNSEEKMLDEKETKDPFGGWEIPAYIKEGLLWLRK
ncbi:MAG: ATP-dependent endonuclease [Bacteroidota bacterium]|nr:ATP-dependent endonuclease [Bacteroidota bacterium]